MARRPHRRRFLRAAGAAIATGLAGCFGSGGPATEPSPTGGSTPTDSATDGSPTPSETPSGRGSSPVLWEEPVGSKTTDPPAVDGDTLYVGTDAGTVHALSTADGHERWSFEAAAGIRSRPLVAGDRVLVVSGTMALYEHHTVHAIEAASGDEAWQFGPEEWWLDLLGVHGGLLYVGTHDDALSEAGQTLYAVDVASGDEEWSGEIGDPRGGLVTGDAVYVPTWGRLYAFDAADGTERWSTSLPDYNFRSLAVAGETVCYVGDVDDARGTLVGVDAATGDRRWTNDDWTATTTTLHDGVLYVGGQRLAAVDPATGESHWEREPGGFVPRVPVRDGTLYVGGDRLRAHDVADGSERWSWSPDVTVEGLVPNGASDGAVYLDSFRDADPRNRYKFAVDADAGEGRWVFDGESELTDLAVADGRVFVGSAEGSVYGLGGV